MSIDEMRQAVEEAKETLWLADVLANDLASLLVGRLRCVNGWDRTRTLKQLKKELQQFNASTGKWKEET